MEGAKEAMKEGAKLGTCHRLGSVRQRADTDCASCCTSGRWRSQHQRSRWWAMELLMQFHVMARRSELQTVL